MSFDDFCLEIQGRPFVPSLSCRRTHRNIPLNIHSVKYPSAAETVDNSMYVDDVLDSCDIVKEAQKLRQQLSELVGDAGFKLRKWSSNKVSVIKGRPPADRLSTLEIKDGLPPTQKTLGVL